MATAYEYIPLERRIAFKKAVAAKRRAWLEGRHKRNPRCDYCKNVTVLRPREYNQQMRHHEEFVATLDHAVPLAKNGGDHVSNWRLSCAICNALKADMKEHEFIELLKSEGVR